MMAFLSPVILLLLLLLPVFAVFFNRRERDYQKRLQIIERNVIYVSSNYRRNVRLVLWGISFGLVVVALARPVWGTEIEIVEIDGLSVMLVLDVSTSMDSQDILPSRLERAKITLQELIQEFDGSEVGLVLFAGQAVVQFPLTTDTLSTVDFMDTISTKSITEQGTNIADALRLASLSLNSASTEQHIIILLTDGESHDGDLTSVLDSLVQNETIVYTVGYGETTGVPIPVRNADGSMIDKADNTGNQVLSSLDEKTLNVIADATGGIYQHVGSLSNEVSVLTQAMGQYLNPALTRGVQARPIERFDIFIAFAVVLLGFEIALSSGQRHVA